MINYTKQLISGYLAFFVMSIIISGSLNAQNLELVKAEKFDVESAYYENVIDFGAPLILANHTTDLSYYDIDFDPMGKLVGSAFLYDDGEIEYGGTFVGETDVEFLDVNLVDETDHQTFLLKTGGPCVLSLPDDDDIPLDFPVKDNMTGIGHFSDAIGLDSFWTSHIIAEENRHQKLWTFGDLTITTGSVKGDVEYVNPDGSSVEIIANSEYSEYVIAIDIFGFLKWSYVSEGDEFSSIRSLAEYEGELALAQNVNQGCQLIYLDNLGLETRDIILLEGIIIFQIKYGEKGNMMLCGIYDFRAYNFNLDFSGGEYYLRSEGSEFFNGFFLMYNEDGGVEWGQTLRGPGNNYMSDFDVENESILATGNWSSNAFFGKDGTTDLELNANAFDSFIARYSMDGDLEWVQSFKSELGSQGNNITVRGENIYVFGIFRDEFDADPDPDIEFILKKENMDWISYYFMELKIKPLSLNEFASKEMVLYPNPASNYIQTLDSNAEILTINDIRGNILRKVDNSIADIRDLPNGMYIIRSIKEGKVFHNSIIVQK